jgi:hypothetical protein
LRSVSEAISTLIIAGTVIIVSITVFYYALANLQQATLASEYGYVRSVFLGLADSFPDLIAGGTYGARLPSRMVGVGYINDTDTRLQIIVLNNTEILVNYTDTPLELQARAYAALYVGYHVIYGRDYVVVNDTGLIPLVREYYKNGATHLVLDTNRFYVKIYEYEVGGEHYYLINIIYVKLNIKLLSSRPVQLSVTLGTDVLRKRLIDVTDLRLIRIHDSIREEISLSDLIPNPEPGSSYIVNLIVKNLQVVIT